MTARAYRTIFYCLPVVGSVLAGCSGYPGPRNVTNEDPAIKIPEIRKAVDERDRSIVPQMLRDLDSDDAAIRFYAIEALQRLTGQTHGYDWTLDDRHARAPAIQQWREAMGFSAPQPPATVPTSQNVTGH